jgi:hypothetical protein
MIGLTDAGKKFDKTHLKLLANYKRKRTYLVCVMVWI